MIDLSTWKKAWALLETRERRNAWIVLAIIIAGGLSSALMVGSVLPFLSVLAQPRNIETIHALNWAYNTFGFTSDYAFLVALGLTSLVVIVIASAIQLLKTWAVARFAMMRIHSLSSRLMASYLQQPYEFFLNRHSGDMGTRILSETQQLVGQFLQPAAEAVSSIFTIIAIIALLLWAEPLVAVLSLAVLGGVYSLTYWLSRRSLKRLGAERTQANSARFRVANEALGGIKDLKLLGRERDYLARFDEPSYKMARAVTIAQFISVMPKFVLEAIAFGGIILLCLILMEPQNLTSDAGLESILPILGLFAFAGQRLMPELSKLYQSLAQIQVSSATVDIIYRDLILQEDVAELPKTQPVGLGMRQQLNLEAVSYHYPDASHAGVREITLTIAAGEKIGIVGSTGAGKTTLADLILGLLNPSTGRLVIDGVPVTKNNLRAWQQSVGYVPQDIFLTDASLSENIALGVPPKDIDHARVVEAAQIAQIDQFITSDLAEGYETSIGERGVRLSGGQRQRIGIARALYHDADLIVFDEATSALDNLTEREVMSAIDALPDEKTVLMIAHRLSTVKGCDRIVVMEGGRIVGFDTWDALIAENFAFQRITEPSKEV
jgi:ABC-type bacteriocin/lantibiotic exporter with double-glycine peptidase domain